MKSVLQKNRERIFLLCIALATAVLVFHSSGLYDLRVDGEIYAAQITSFAQGKIFLANPDVVLRIFKPLYSIIGGTVLHVSNPYLFILVLNLFFYFALTLIAFEFLKLLDFSKEESFIGVLWIITAYPLLKYGLALSTDISGWFFTLSTITVGLIALRERRLFLFSLASTLGFLGAISKETGVIGLIAIFLLVLWRGRKEKREAIERAVSLALPALLLYGLTIISILGKAPTFLDWYKHNTATYGSTFSLLKFILVQGSAFGLLWIFAGVGAVSIYKRGDKKIDFIACALIAALPILLWPIFISRIFFIEFIWVVPLALIGLREIKAKLSPQNLRLLVLLPIAFSVSLFILSAGGSLFKIF